MEKLKAGFFGMGGNGWLISDWLKDTIEKAGYEIVICTEWESATHKWTIDTWRQTMNMCDVVLCPQRVDIQPGKSSVKATVAMALGMPVIASPLQAYKEIIHNGENGYIAETKEEWFKALTELRDPNVRRKVGTAAKDIVKDFSLEAITKKWTEELTKLINGFYDNQKKVKEDVKPKAARELVDIVIPNYNNVEYLKLCISSILMNTNYPFHIVISDSGSNEETWSYLRSLKGITVLGDPTKRKTFSEACNEGIRNSNSKYFVILNSDVIVSKGWLNNMVEKMETVDRLASCGVLSNCDRGWLHGAPGKPTYPMRLPRAGIELVPGMKIDTMKPHIEELYAFMAESNKVNKGKFTKQEWVAAYATIFARSAVNEVGLFDTIFKNGCEDLDLCMRLSKTGFACGQAIDAFVYHFGGCSRGSYQTENKEAYDKEDRENHIKLRDKWVKQRISIWTGPALEPWDKAKVDAGMAGSETWASYLSEAFVRKGYEVTLYNDLLTSDKKKPVYEPVKDSAGKDIGAVKYVDHTMLQEDIQYQYIDYFISSRSVEPIRHSIHSGRSYVMVHDVFLNMDRNYDLMAWKVSKYAYLSEWHGEFLKQYHKGMPKDKMFMTANGIPWELYKDVDSVQKKNQTVYSSSPDRGLYQLLQMLPQIRAEVPDFQLLICYGFFNWETASKMRNDTDSLELIKKIKALMEQPGVVYLDRVNKKTLAQHQMESKVWAMPEWFDETFSITAVEAGASKNAIVTTAKGGFITTVGSAGQLLPPDGLSRDGEYPKSYTDEFVKRTVQLLKDEGLRKDWANKAYEKMKVYSWDTIADGWIEQFKK